MDNAKIIAVDFDGTLVENKWPEIGAPIEKTSPRLRPNRKLAPKIILLDEPSWRTFGKSACFL